MKVFFILIFLLGLLSTIFAIMTVGEPLHKLVSAINAKNVEYLSVPSTVMSVLVNGLWTIYGLLLLDFMLTVIFCNLFTRT